MLFSSLTFVWFFLPALALIYYISPGRKLKNGVLLMASLVFYSWGEPRYVVLVVLSILLNYGFGLALDGCEERKGLKKAVFILSILVNLGLLGYFKYFNFFLELAMSLLGRQGFAPRDIALPIGISFYTFQSISYLADTFRGENPAQRNVFRLALYISLFPQILSGPIVKYHELEPQIGNRQESLSMHAYGIKRFVYGLVKKMVFANMFGQVVDRMFDLPLEQLGTVTVWLAVILYSFQIYYDFSGYSDMAIGLGRMFGFTYKENFNYPYLSASVSEFWRRWHISLSTWFRQYLYIPLGIPGNGTVAWGQHELHMLGRVLRHSYCGGTPVDWQDFRKKSPEVPESSVHPWGGGSGLAAVSGGYPAQRKNTVKGNADSQQGTVESADFCG